MSPTHYRRMQTPPPSGGTPQIRIGGPLTPVLKWFMIANAAVFVFMSILSEQARHGFVMFFGLVPDSFWGSFPAVPIWQLFSFNFLHGGFSHLFFNMLALYFFGGELERKFGPRRFAFFFAVSGVGAGLSMLLTSPGMQIPVVGASGIVYGVLLAYGLTWPNRIVYLYFLIPMKVKHLVMIFGAIEVWASISHSQSGVAHLAHLGGMVFGYLYLRYDRIYMKLRERYYRRKLDKLKGKFTVVNGDKDDDGPTYH
jgi:rhomboid family protein